ncbi:glycosyltransferase family 4 protein [Halorhodospira halophila]|uniref:glycosyltransferase family 4 protein n=1 Tax=Halorhodospira halophila TaxID=1053 RepID=UPI001911A31C|nr:glycosyltransferase family 4 protein [Halorhodospira halophila]
MTISAIFNATTNTTGGAVQNAAHFVYYAQRDTSIKWTFFLSNEVSETAQALGASKDQTHVFSSPARSRKERTLIEKQINAKDPDLVYTMAGPAYVRTCRTHVLGISDPYITHAGLEPYLAHPPSAIAKRFVATVYKTWWCSSHSFYIFQTEHARECFCKRFKIPQHRTSVVPNAVGRPFYTLKNDTNRPNHSQNQEHIILTPAAPYPTKNLEIIPRVADVLRSDVGPKFLFYLTLPKDCLTLHRIRNEAHSLGVGDFIQNIGTTPYIDLMKLYQKASVVFLPSILETFSTVYAEAMHLGIPLVIPRRSFNTSVCGEAAFYYEKKPAEAANAISHAVNDKDTAAKKIKAGKKIAAQNFGTQEQRYNKIANIIKCLAKEGTV